MIYDIKWGAGGGQVIFHVVSRGVIGFEPVHGISNNVVCAPAKHQISLGIRAV